MKAQPGFTPPLTLLKPVQETNRISKTHLASFFEQDYPEYEILFCARSETDEGLEIARRVAARHPKYSCQIFFHGRAALHQRQSGVDGNDGGRAAHDILVISDSDVRVTPDYLRAVALPFADEKVGAIAVLIAAWRRAAGCGRGSKQWA